MWRLCQSRNVFAPPACKGTKYSVSFVITLLHECALRIVIFTQTPPPHLRVPRVLQNKITTQEQIK